MGGKEGTDYPETIKKRNGTQVPFDAQKIRDAVRKANEAAQVEAISPKQFHELNGLQGTLGQDLLPYQPP